MQQPCCTRVPCLKKKKTAHRPQPCARSSCCPPRLLMPTFERPGPLPSSHSASAASNISCCSRLPRMRITEDKGGRGRRKTKDTERGVSEEGSWEEAIGARSERHGGLGTGGQQPARGPRSDPFPAAGARHAGTRGAPAVGPTCVAQRQVASHVVAQPGHRLDEHGQVLRHEHLDHLPGEAKRQRRRRVCQGTVARSPDAGMGSAARPASSTCRQHAQLTRSKQVIRASTQRPGHASPRLVRPDARHHALVRAQQAVLFPDAARRAVVPQLELVPKGGHRLDAAAGAPHVDEARVRQQLHERHADLGLCVCACVGWCVGWLVGGSGGSGVSRQAHGKTAPTHPTHAVGWLKRRQGRFTARQHPPTLPTHPTHAPHAPARPATASLVVPRLV